MYYYYTYILQLDVTYAYINPIKHHWLLMFLDSPLVHQLSTENMHNIAIYLLQVIKLTYVQCFVTHWCPCIIAIFPRSHVYARLQTNSAVLNEQRDLSSLFHPEGLHLHLHLGDFAVPFIQSKLTTSFMHTFTHRWRSQPRRVTASTSGAVRVWRLAQAHLYTPGRSQGVELSNYSHSHIQVTSPPVLAPELLLPPPCGLTVWSRVKRW